MRQALIKAAKAFLLVDLSHQSNLTTLSLFNQAFEFAAVITSDSHQVSPYLYFTDVSHIAYSLLRQCCFTQTHVTT